MSCAGALPWVSNLGPDHFFGTIFEVEDRPGEIVMFLADCADPGDHAAAVQAVSGDGRHRHLWRAVPRRLRSRRPDPGGASRPLREEDPRRIHPVAGRHGDRPDQGLHRDHEGGRRLARPRQPLTCRNSRPTSSELLAGLEAETMELAREPYNDRRRLLAHGRRASPARPAMPASPPRMRRCFIAARAAT